jgi:GT2 family glycosyltransferase
LLQKSNKLADYQQKALWRHARKEENYLGLIYYYAAKRDITGLSEVEKKVTLSSERAMLTLFQGGDPVTLVDEVNEDLPGWMVYALAKALLSKGRLDLAVELVQKLGRTRNLDVTIVNLLIRHICRKNAPREWKSLVKISLKLAPQQPDILALRDAMIAGSGDSPEGGLTLVEHELYLSVLPQTMSASFYVPLHRGELHLRACLESVLSQTHPLDAVYIVDEGTTDRSMDIAAEYPVTVLSQQRSAGLAAARNAAFSAAKSTFVAAVDSNVCPQPDYLQNVLMEFENGPPELAAACGRLLEANQDTSADCWRARHLSQDPGQQRVYNPDFIYGSNTVHRRQVVVSMGGFDEGVSGNSEDVDMSHRLRHMGYGVAFTPCAEAKHLHRDTPRSVLDRFWDLSAGHGETRAITDKLDRVFLTLPNLLQRCIEFTNSDCVDGHSRAAYVDFLHFFHDACRLFNHCMDKGTLDTASGRSIEQRLINTIAKLDVRYGGSLHAKVLSDCGDMLPEVTIRKNTRSTLPHSHEASLSAFVKRLHIFYETIPEALYWAMVNDTDSSHD